MVDFQEYVMKLYLIPHYFDLSTNNPISIFNLAASYSYGLALNHPFIDGNKRTALTVAAIFLEINGYSLSAKETETVVTFERLASGLLTETQLALWFKDSSILNT